MKNLKFFFKEYLNDVYRLSAMILENHLRTIDKSIEGYIFDDPETKRFDEIIQKFINCFVQQNLEKYKNAKCTIKTAKNLMYMANKALSDFGATYLHEKFMVFCADMCTYTRCTYINGIDKVELNKKKYRPLGWACRKMSRKISSFRYGRDKIANHNNLYNWLEKVVNGFEWIDGPISLTPPDLTSEFGNEPHLSCTSNFSHTARCILKNSNAASKTVMNPYLGSSTVFAFNATSGTLCASDSTNDTVCASDSTSYKARVSDSKCGASASNSKNINRSTSKANIDPCAFYITNINSCASNAANSTSVASNTASSTAVVSNALSSTATASNASSIKAVLLINIEAFQFIYNASSSTAVASNAASISSAVASNASSSSEVAFNASE